MPNDNAAAAVPLSRTAGCGRAFVGAGAPALLDLAASSPLPERNDASSTRLVAAVLSAQNEEWQLRQRCMTRATMTGRADDNSGGLPMLAAHAA